MKNWKLKLRDLASAAAFITFASLGSNAYAGGGGPGGIVFDPTNFMQNIQTAASSVKSELLAVESAIREIQMLQNSVKNAANTVIGLTGIGDLGASLASLQQQWDVDKQLIGELGGQAQFVSNVMAQFGASGTGGNFMNYVQSLAKSAQLGQQNAKSLFSNYTNLTSELQKTIGQRAAIAAKNSGSIGTNDAIRLTNASLDNLAEINQATLQGISTLVRQSAYQQSADAAKDQRSSDTLSSYFNSVKTDASNAANKAPSATGILGY